MSPLKIGSRDVKAVKIGSRNIIRIMHGTREIWAADEPPEPSADLTGAVNAFGTLSNATTASAQYGNRLKVLDGPLTVRALRHFASTSDEAALQTLRLWRVSDEALLATVNVTGVQGQWVAGDITPVVLEEDEEYVVSARLASGGSRSIARSPNWIVHAAEVEWMGGHFQDTNGFPAASGVIPAPTVADILYDEPSLPSETPFNAITWSGASTASLNNRVGWRFTVGASDVVVNRLRIYVNHTDVELALLHRHSDGRILAGVEITGVQGEWVEGAVTPVRLEAGQDYVVSTRRINSASRSVYRNPSSITVDSRVTKVSGNAGNLLGSSLTDMPATTSSNVYTCVDFGFADD